MFSAGLLRKLTFSKAPWEKWVTEEMKQLSRERIAQDSSLRLLIARICGHPIFSGEQMKRAVKNLFDKVDRFHMLPESAASFVRQRVEAGIEFYIKNFGLVGLDEGLS